MRRRLAAAATVVAGLGLYAAVRASGAPVAAMLYTGVATQGGLPVAGPTVGVTLSLLDASGALLCPSKSTTAPTDALGRFTAQFNPGCNDVLLNAQPAVLQVDLAYGGGTLTSRKQLGVVPYAVESLHAVAADTATLGDRATPGGALDQRLASLAPALMTSDGGSPLYDVVATYCGATAPFDGSMLGTTNSDANVAGYAGTSPFCSHAVGCTAEGNAHMCTAEEVVRSAAIGRLPLGQVGWYAGGVLHDCLAYTSNAPDALGLVWFDDEPSVEICSQSYPVLCCK